MQHWREWKQQQREQEKHPPRPRVNKSERAPLTPSSPTGLGSLKDFLSRIPGYKQDANGHWVDPNFCPQPSTPTSLFNDINTACQLFNELTPEQRIREAAGHVAVSSRHSEAFLAVKGAILANAALDGAIFDLA